MKAFHTIAVPNKDILAGDFTMDTFAADLWEVSQKRGPDEYKDAETFFNKTYITDGLKNLLSIVEKRLKGKGGDPVVQVQTPFGGGKTHALIAMYHKVEEWRVKKGVVVGTALGPEITLWGLLEKQLTGEMKVFTGQVAPGKEAIRELLYAHQPLIILMDEVLEYTTKAAGVRVGDTTLAQQTIAFMQELTEVVGTLEKVSLILTLPSSIIEHYDESAERLFQQLQKVAGRVEKIYTPLQESEITRIIRRRLFSSLNEDEAKSVVGAFIDYSEKEGIIPAGVQPSEYRDRFMASYPFMPEVVDVLYHRWGSFPTFQRTRGVLRLLALVIYSLKGSDKPYMSLADFDLSNQDIRQELLKHIGIEFNSVLAADITDADAGSKKVDDSLGNAYQGLKLGTRAASTIFLYSFSGGHERGSQSGEIKRSATTMANPASVIAESNEQLKRRLFYLQNVDDKYFFSNQPNLNRILITKMENINDENEIKPLEQDLLKRSIKGKNLKVYIWEEDSGNIPDTEDLKLVILRRENKDIMNTILKTKGQAPRVNRNTLFFLYPLESERPSFLAILKRKIAYEAIDSDPNLSLTTEQEKVVKKELKNLYQGLNEYLRRFYRMVFIPVKDGMRDIDIGIPTYGERKGLDEEVYEKLRTDGEIIEKIAPLVMREKYLHGKEYVSTEQLYQSALKTPGETRPINRGVIERGITEGVRNGLFGLGEIEDDKLICRYFKEQATVALSINEIIIKESICDEQKKKEIYQAQAGIPAPELTIETDIGIHDRRGEEKHISKTSEKLKNKVHLLFKVPKGKVAGIMGIMNLLQSKFDTLDVELSAANGGISEQDYEDKILEAFNQLDIELDQD